jgi:hypothetical protein
MVGVVRSKHLLFRKPAENVIRIKRICFANEVYRTDRIGTIVLARGVQEGVIGLLGFHDECSFAEFRSRKKPNATAIALVSVVAKLLPLLKKRTEVCGKIDWARIHNRWASFLLVEQS